MTPIVPAMNEPKAEIPRVCAGPPFTRHLVPVQAGDDRGGFPWNVDQYGRSGAAVHGAVVNARHHDDGGDRVDAEGRGEQEGDGADRPDTGQDAYKCADEHPDEAVKEVRESHARGKSLEYAAEDLHAIAPGTRGRPKAGCTGEPTRRAHRYMPS